MKGGFPAFSPSESREEAEKMRDISGIRSQMTPGYLPDECREGDKKKFWNDGLLVEKRVLIKLC